MPFVCYEDDENLKKDRKRPIFNSHGKLWKQVIHIPNHGRHKNSISWYKFSKHDPGYS